MKSQLDIDIVATPAKNTYLDDCIMLSVTVRGAVPSDWNGYEVLFLAKVVCDAKHICRRFPFRFEYEDFGISTNIPLRIASACVTGSLGDEACSCYSESVQYLKRIGSMGFGIFIYMPQEGFGRGLHGKLRDHRLQCGLGIDALLSR